MNQKLNDIRAEALAIINELESIDATDLDDTRGKLHHIVARAWGIAGRATMRVEPDGPKPFIPVREFVEFLSSIVADGDILDTDDLRFIKETGTKLRAFRNPTTNILTHYGYHLERATITAATHRRAKYRITVIGDAPRRPSDDHVSNLP